jgi:hypothetical protein
MEEVKLRLGLVLSVTDGRFSVGREDFNGELVCVQLRKTLELIAFASLTANKAKYAQTYADFATDWNAKRLLTKIEKIHPEFYPKPVEFAQQGASGVKHFTEVTDGFLIRDEFVTLYNKCSEVLHARNPFRTDPKIVDFGYSIRDWVGRIQRLLALHWMQLVDSEDIWFICMQDPEDGKVHALTAQPKPDEEVGYSEIGQADQSL